MENEIIKENSRNKSSRNSGIDFLRAIAILLIIMSHSVPFYGDSSHPSFINLRMETTNIQILVLIAFVYFGQIGNSIFVIISSYYLLESSKVKKDKVLNIVIDTILFSLLFMILLLVCGYDIGLKNIIKSFFPITFANNWFIGCYLLLYLIHPYLNIIIEGISRKELLGINVVGIFLYSIISFFLGGGFYYYTPLVGFVVIYFMVAYIKKWKSTSHVWQKTFIFSVVLFILSLIILNIAALNFPFLSGQMLRWSLLVNPIITVMTLSLFFIFKETNNKIVYHGTVKIVISLISSLSLLIYVIHQNILIANYVKPQIWSVLHRVFGYQYLVGLSLVFTVASFIISFFISVLYKKWGMEIVHKNILFIEKKAEGIITNLFRKLWLKK